MPLREDGPLAPKKPRSGLTLSLGFEPNEDNDEADMIVIKPDGKPERTKLEDDDC